MGCVIFVRGAGVSHTIEPGCQLEFELSGARPGVASLHCNIISSKHAQHTVEFTRVPVCCWSPCSGAQIPASCVLACYWSMAVCYWGSSQSQTTTQLAGIWAPLHGDQQHTGTLVHYPNQFSWFHRNKMYLHGEGID